MFRKITLSMILIWLALGAPIALPQSSDECDKWIIEGMAGKKEIAYLCWRSPSGDYDPNSKIVIDVNGLPSWATVTTYERLKADQIKTNFNIDPNEIEEAYPPVCDWSLIEPNELENSIFGVAKIEFKASSVGTFSGGTVKTYSYGQFVMEEPIIFVILMPRPSSHIHCRINQ
jgi:hypothetical protein